MIEEHFDRLRILTAIIHYGTMSKAAHALDLTQSGVSQHMTKLERTLGRTLLVRRGRQVLPTPDAHLLCDHTRTCLAELEQAERLLQQRDQKDTERIRITTSGLIACEVLPHALKQFMYRHPTVEPIITAHDDPLAIEAAVRSEQADLGLTVGPIADTTLEQHMIRNFNHVVICGPNHEWAQRNYITLNTLNEKELLVLPTTTRSRQYIDSILRKAGVHCPPRMELASTAAIREMVKLGLGIAIVPRFAVTADCKAGLLHAITLRSTHIQQDLIALHLPGRCTDTANSLIQAMTATVEK